MIEYFFYFVHPSRCQIRYRIIVYETNGTTLASWEEEGKASDVGGLWDGQWSLASLATEAAIIDGAENFVRNFGSQPRIKQWLESHGIVVPAIPE